MRSFRACVKVSVVVVLLATTALVAFGATPASADPIQVTNGDNDGPGSLRQAALDAENSSGSDTITIDPSVVTINITSPIDINASDAVSIIGNGATIDAHGSIRALNMASDSNFALSNLGIVGVGGTGTGTSSAIGGSGG